ncbi:MAG: TadE family protein [Chloroflexota bacterium]
MNRTNAGIRSRFSLALRRGEHAQGLVEFAILATFLFFLFQGTIDFARVMYYQNAITATARSGAEVASNHCAFSGSCGTNSTPVSDAFVMWSTYCEANPYAKLQPSYTSCSASSSKTFTPSCSGTCTPCAQDICVSPSSRTTGTKVTVTVGYSFHPLTLLMAPFFSDQSCFTGDDPATNHHTLCASATGRVS